MSLLELRNVEAQYGATIALHGVSITVDHGEFVALLGASGAGKTTVLGVVTGGVKTRGEVLLDDERHVHRTPERLARRGISHIPADGGVFDALTVGDNLQLGAWARRGTSTRDLVRVFELFPRLYELRGLRASALARAERQMLALGRALMSRPRALLLDEPSRGLAAAAARKVFDVLRHLHASGTTIVVAEQRARLALAVADRGVLLESGRIAAGGTAAELRASDAVRRSLLGA